ncbi:zinc finger protein 57 [Plutella xylostella]|uniref:zinc finger protein 57 n=1 Tax=Plutella xylostella TaxID=51655 RepID=UPI0020324C22|nr:zinc finger protein 57 [Plutella xylostella]
MRKLFPSCEIITRQCCKDCTNSILHIYTLMKRNLQCKYILLDIIKSLTKTIDESLNSKRKLNMEIEISVPAAMKDFFKSDKCKIKNKIGDYRFECKKCDMKFPSTSNLQEHKEIAHKATSSAVLCDVCGKNCVTPKSLKSHLNCHTQETCKHCNKVLKTHAHFRKHLKSHKTGVKMNHNSKSLYKCQQCDYESGNSKSLEGHMNKVHLKVRPYECNICDRAFYRQCHLKEHIMSTHSDKEKEICHVCGDSFANKYSLEAHLRVHTNDRPFQCEVCSSKFVSLRCKNEHVKIKHSEKNECCPFCEKKFTVKKYLNRHMKMSHGKDTVSLDYSLENIQYQM